MLATSNYPVVSGFRLKYLSYFKHLDTLCIDTLNNPSLCNGLGEHLIK